jgi:hypothetical protein
MSEAAKSQRLRVDAVDDLVHGIDRFPFARTAAKNEHAGDQLKVLIVVCLEARLMALGFGVFALDDGRNTYRLAAVTAQYTAELFRRQCHRHEDCSLDRIDQAANEEDIK